MMHLLHESKYFMVQVFALLLVFICMPLSYANGQGMYEFASIYSLSEEDLHGYTKEELKIMRNEILARHGQIFTAADLKKHFKAQSWYEPSSDDVSYDLSYIERENIELISEAEKRGFTKLVHDDRTVKRITPYLTDGGYGSASGYMLIVYETKPVSWAMYGFYISSNGDSEDDGRYIDSENIEQTFSRNRLLNAVSYNEIADGTGELPTIKDENGYHLEYRGKKRNLSDSEGGWYDYALVSASGSTESNTTDVLLPRKTELGRVGYNEISKIIVKDENRAFVYTTPAGETRFVSTETDFQITDWNNATKSIKCLGNAFIAQNNGSWVIYSSEETSGRQLPFDNSHAMNMRLCGSGYYGSSGYCPFVVAIKDGRARYLIGFASSTKIYRLPSLSKDVSSTGSYNYNTVLAIPGFGRVEVSSGGYEGLSFSVDGESVDLSEFLIENN
ncbi:MAG: YARHG domain-containing protein [Ignavibacteria bacterium]|nr:YARHG domain-containing protein [Ignavibacteria bacterium]